jgi:DNA-binding response OmpR family regulator
MKRRERRDRARIAIVDDEGDFRAILRAWLAPRYDTLSFLDAEDLLESGAESLPLDLIISDVRMPGMNGFKLAETLRGDPRWARVPILFLTGLDSDEGFVMGWEAGGAAYLAKPVERKDLLDKIESLLQLETVGA